MNNLFRGLLAGYGAKKLGGGCFSTVLIFVVLWVLLGQCGDQRSSQHLLDAPDAITRTAPESSATPAISLHTVTP